MLDWLNPGIFTAVQLLVIALLVEAVAENILWAIQGKMTKEKIVPVIAALVVAAAAKLDLFYYAGIQLAVPVLGYFLSGVLISRGANVVHDLLKRLGQEKAEEAPQG